MKEYCFFNNVKERLKSKILPRLYTYTYKNDDNKVYVGSTTYPLSYRKRCHYKDCYVLNKNTKFYSFVKNNGGFENFKLELYGEYQGISKNELIQKEKELIRKKGTLNSNYKLL